MTTHDSDHSQTSDGRQPRVRFTSTSTAGPTPTRITLAERKRRHPLLPLGTILAVLMAIVLSGGGVIDHAANAATSTVGSQGAATATVDAQTSASASPSGAAAGASDQTVQQVAAEANPAVVTVTTLASASSSQGGQLFGGSQNGQTPFGQSPSGGSQFGGSQSGSSNGNGSTSGDQPISSGSGFIWDSNGDVITNAHVVAGGSSFSVTFQDGTTDDATLVGKDVYADIAVLHVQLSNGQSLPAVASIGSSKNVSAGEEVVAIGSPFGELTNTVSDGIVGATDRSLPAAPGVYDMTGLIQHDAAIYPGNSGGPLLNLQGQVIGINVAKLQDQQTGQTSGIGFAIAIDSAKPLITDIIDSGSVARPYLGVQTQVTQSGGEGVVKVENNGPADGVLKAGDLITGIDGKDIGFDAPFLNALFTHKPGDTVKLTIERDGTTQTVSVKLGSRPNDAG